MSLNKPNTRQQRARNQKRMDYRALEPRQMLSSNLPDVDGQIALTREFISNDPSTAYLLQDRSDLRFVEVKHGLASTTTRFQQTVDDVAVHGAYVTINQNGEGELQRIHHTLAFNTSVVTFPELEENVPFTVSAAEEAAMEHAGVKWTLAPMRGDLGWYVDATGEIHQVWDIMVFSGIQPVGDFLTIVDINTNEVIHQENRAGFARGTGDAFVPNPWQTKGNGTGLADNDDATSPELEAEMVTVELERLDEGTGLLVGEWVDLATLNSPDLEDVDADEPTRVYQYDRDDPRFEQVVVYHTVDQLNEYFHDLGFDDDTGTPNGIRDFPTLANAHWFEADQSFYSTGDDAIHMGDGGVDDGEDADIIAHEFGHAIHFNQNSTWGGGEMGAMGEGFGDWLAAAFFADVGDPDFLAEHAAAVGEWDALSYSSDDPPNLRRVDGNKMYPSDLGFGFHADGEIWSRALWDLFHNVGKDQSMQLVLEHHFMIPSAASMTQAAETLMMAHENMFDNDNLAAVRHPFVERGILPAQTVVSFDQSLYMTDDVITITVSDAGAIGPNPFAIVTTNRGETESVSLTQTSTGLLVGSLPISDVGPTPNDGTIGVNAEFTDVTVRYAGIGGFVEDTAVIEAEIETIVGTNGDDVIVVTIGDAITNVNVNGDDFPLDRSLIASLNFDAMAGYDRITIIDSSQNDETTIGDNSVNVSGGFNFIADSVEWVSVQSGGGSDTARIHGTELGDELVSSVTETVLTQEDTRYGVEGYVDVRVFGRGGSNVATFTDTAGNDRLNATDVFATLQAGSRSVNARDFNEVTVRAVNGGFDVASLHGSEGTDLFYATPALSQINTGNDFVRAVGFERTNADGRGGDDHATLLGSEFDDRLNAGLRNTYLFGESFFNQARNFENVNVIGNGGSDQAILRGSPGDDTLIATPDSTTISSDNFRVQAQDFRQITALGSSGFDNATFVGTTGRDRYVARPNSAFMIGQNYLYYAIDFNRVTAKGHGGNDSALLIGSAEDNFFFGSKAESYLSGSTFFNSAEGFRYLSLRFNNAALVVGTVVDSTGDDTLFARQNKLSFFGDDYLIDAIGLDIVNAKSENGGTDNAFADLANFEVNLLGDWI